MEFSLWSQGGGMFAAALIVAFLVGTPSAVSANTTIVVCNKGDAELLVASYKVYDSYDPVEAWSRIQPGECRSMHSDFVSTNSLIHINEGAVVNLAFLRRNRDGKLVPYLRSFGYDPDGTKARPRILCVPHPPNPAEWTVRVNSGRAYLPPCRAGVTPTPVSFTGYIQGEYHLTLDVFPRS